MGGLDYRENVLKITKCVNFWDYINYNKLFVIEGKDKEKFLLKK